MSSNPTNIENDHNVYILGAGFSRHAGYPLIYDFLDQMRDARSVLMSQKRSREAAAIDSVFDYMVQSASACQRVRFNPENIEELFSLSSIEQAIDDDIALAVAATLDASPRIARKTFPLELYSNEWSKYPEQVLADWNVDKFLDDFYSGRYGGAVPEYVYFVGSLLGTLRADAVEMKGKNTFITFNYDTLVEAALSELKIGFNFGVDKKALSVDESLEDDWSIDLKSVEILKVHGSVAWALPESRGTQHRAYQSYDELKANALTPSIIPPTWQKSLGSVQRKIIETAAERMTTATRVVVIGFSMPPTDTHFRFLMASGLRDSQSLREIVFVDPAGDPVFDRARQMLAPDFVNSGRVKFEKQTLAEFCSGKSAIGRGV